jgi:hypothetical protein
MKNEVKKNSIASEPVVETMPSAASESLSRFGTKRDVAAMLQMSIRSVDMYLASGCPVVKLSQRRCRFDLLEVREWFKKQYGQQRTGRAGSKSGGQE